MKELRAILADQPEGIRLVMQDDMTNLSTVIADIDGPEDTPFQGGVFRCKLELSAQYPNAPPKGYFLTRIFHPNVSKSGEICVNTLKKDWTPDLGLKHVLLVIRCLLINPNPESALNEEAGKLMQEDYEDYARRVALMTKIHAKPANAAVPGAADAKGASAASEDAESESKSQNANINASAPKPAPSIVKAAAPVSVAVPVKTAIKPVSTGAAPIAGAPLAVKKSTLRRL